MPRPRTPTSQLELKGAVRHDPSRYSERKDEPAFNGPVGDPPPHLDPARRAIWTELVDTVPADVLQKSDRIILELATTLTHALRNGELNVAAIAQLRQTLASLGMTPADRSRVAAAPKPNESDPTDFLM